MAYSDFTLDNVEAALGLDIRPGNLFPELAPWPVPAWVREVLGRNREVAVLNSEKARSEFLVAPVLTAARDFLDEPLAIYSGQRLDVDSKLGLVGECDYILALTPVVARLKFPLVTILEAKRGDIEAGLGQCIAQCVAARIFNEKAGEPPRPIFGCVTTGDDWQFLRLDGSSVVIDQTMRYLSDLGGILAALREWSSRWKVCPDFGSRVESTRT